MTADFKALGSSVGDGVSVGEGNGDDADVGDGEGVGDGAGAGCRNNATTNRPHNTIIKKTTNRVLFTVF